MKTIKSIYLIVFLLVTGAVFAENKKPGALVRSTLKGLEYRIKAGVNIGGTSPLPLPAEIREINSYRPGAQLAIEGNIIKWFDRNRKWGGLFGKVVEGPSIVKQGGLYYMFYSANDFRSQDYAVGYATSDSPFGPWRKSEKNPLLHKVEELVGTGHGAPFLDKAGRYRYIFHAHKSQTEVNQRNSYIIDMSLTGKDRVSIGGGLIRPEVVK